MNYTALKPEWVNEDLFDEANYSQEPHGPASKSCCKVTRGNVCGSGSIVGKNDGKTYVLTNAHVIGSRLGLEGNFLFPFAGNRTWQGRIIAAGYSNRTMMDFALCVIDDDVPLPAWKLSIELPDGEHYTGGYPRCRGPYFQKLTTHQFRNGGVVWLWRPDSIGGQSGSGVHDFDTNHQVGLLTWSYGGGYGAGQTARGIWFQMKSKSAIGIPRMEGLVPLCGNCAPEEDLIEGVSVEAGVTDYPFIWAHLSDDGGDGGDPSPEPDPDQPCNPSLAKELLASADRLEQEAVRLKALAAGMAKPDSGDDDEGGDGPLFGLEFGR